MEDLMLAKLASEGDSKEKSAKDVEQETGYVQTVVKHKKPKARKWKDPEKEYERITSFLDKETLMRIKMEVLKQEDIICESQLVNAILADFFAKHEEFDIKNLKG